MRASEIVATYRSAKVLFCCEDGELSGAPTRTRTADLLITNQLLYQLSYRGIEGVSVANDGGFGNKKICRVAGILAWSAV